MRLRNLLVLGPTGALVWACSSGSTATSGDGGAHDGAHSGSSSATKDAGHDGAGKRDGGSSSGSSSASSHLDSGVDAGVDAPSEAASDASADAGHDGGVDGGGALHDAAHDTSSRDTGPEPDAGTDAGGIVSAQSCKPTGAGTSFCGASTESCCTSLEVAAGMFDRQYTNSGGAPTNESAPATVSAFKLDKYLVTVGRFRQFVDAVLPPGGGAGWVPPVGSGKHTHLNDGQGLANSAAPGTFEPGWVASDDANIAPTVANLACIANYSTWTASAGANESLPINCVDWAEAYAFCIWDGGFLPSESEWGYAAAGGAQQLQYPWGATDPGTMNLYAIYACHYPNGLGSCSGVVDVAAVGSATMGAGLWGQLDLAGDVDEWVADALGSYVTPCVDCGLVGPASTRVIRGGDFHDLAAAMLPPARSSDTDTSRSDLIGLRCARTP